jgi:hypothetical protein
MAGFRQNTMKRDGFFEWCGDNGLADDAMIAAALDVSVHIVSSWRQQSAMYELPTWVDLACSGEDDAPPMTRDEFFAWCEVRGIEGNSAISTVFSPSSQTIRNWRQRQGDFVMPTWLTLACNGFDTLSNDGPPILPKVTIGWFTSWQRRNHFKTYYDTSRIFGLKRQAVHNWFKRGRFPKWLALACAGHDVRVSAVSLDSLDREKKTNRQFKNQSTADAAD